MAKQQLTKEAIAFIISCRDNPKEIHTWKNIADLVADKFGVKLSFQAIAKSYHANKGKVENQFVEPVEPVKNTVNDTATINPAKPTFKPKKLVPNLSEPTFKKGEKIDLDDLFDEAKTE